MNEDARGENSTANATDDSTGEARDSGIATATKIKERATETADKAMDTTAGGMESAADTIREKFEGQGGIQEKAGTTVASGMERTAEYLREHDTQAVLSDVEAYVKNHPAQALVGAVALGFVIGRVMR
jgi:ElaB/YqjD/DUF883 family membrane-anchored ribosome-binding protein